MSIFYILLAVSLVAIEASSKFDTRNVIEKLGACIMFMGAVVNLVTPTHFIAVGAGIYFASRMVEGYLSSHNRRANDASQPSTRPVKNR